MLRGKGEDKLAEEKWCGVMYTKIPEDPPQGPPTHPPPDGVDLPASHRQRVWPNGTLSLQVRPRQVLRTAGLEGGIVGI